MIEHGYVGVVACFFRPKNVASGGTPHRSYNIVSSHEPKPKGGQKGWQTQLGKYFFYGGSNKVSEFM
jgi:hypothetical protein